MARPLSQVAPEWWDYTTLDPEILSDAAKLTEKSLFKLSRPGFTVHYHETLEDFYLAEALEYVESWQKATADNPVGLCGPIGPTEQLPLVARIVNSLGINLKYAHFWGMDEWVENGKPVGIDHPLSFAKADFEMCFNRIDKKLRMPKENIHFPSGDLKAYSKTYDQIECAIMQGGQGDTKHWAFNDPVRRKGKYKDNPPTPEEYRKLATRVTELHPITVLQNARTSNGGYVANVAREAATVGPVETWKAKKVSIWQAGTHDNPFGMRLSAWMIARKIPDSAVPMSLLADHPNVHFHYWRPAIKTVGAEMH
ncbi:MAG: glucosamine-6-phosphate isomerase [Thermoguttaceae bacterium]|nr:glucosamine-6-phosphate isomerase [Thermoguttaceae bacterium]